MNRPYSLAGGQNKKPELVKIVFVPMKAGK
jgi:hypothetical protein